MRDRLRRLGDLPIYPELLAAAAVVSILAASTASVHALARPLLVAIAVVALIQLLSTGLIRERHLGGVVGVRRADLRWAAQARSRSSAGSWSC